MNLFVCLILFVTWRLMANFTMSITSKKKNTQHKPISIKHPFPKKNEKKISKTMMFCVRLGTPKRNTRKIRIETFLCFNCILNRFFFLSISLSLTQFLLFGFSDCSNNRQSRKIKVNDDDEKENLRWRKKETVTVCVWKKMSRECSTFTCEKWEEKRKSTLIRIHIRTIYMWLMYGRKREKEPKKEYCI